MKKNKMKKNNIKMNDPNYKLAKEQFPSINKQFYNDYFNGYFLFKITDLVDKLANPSNYLNYIKDEKLELGKLGFDNPIENENDIMNFAKIELIDSYYHGLESFIRLFLAHASLKDCPWIEICNLSINSYQSAIRKLANDDFDWLNDKLNGDITVLYVLTGYDKIPEGITQEDLKGLRFWISWISKELLDHKEHNSYKHGLALFSKQANVRMSNSETTLFSFNGDSINTLQVEKKSDRNVWVNSSKYIKYDRYCTILQVVSRLINNMILVGKYHYIDADYKIEWLPNKDFNPIMIMSDNDLSEESGIQGLKCEVKGSSKTLLYYK